MNEIWKNTNIQLHPNQFKTLENTFKVIYSSFIHKSHPFLFLFYHISSICRAPLRNTAIGLFLTGWLGDRLVHLAGGAVPWRHIAQQRLPYPALVGRGWRDGGSQVRLTLVRLSTLWAGGTACRRQGGGPGRLGQQHGAHRARTPRFSMIAKHN